jgi:heat shock protein HslJ
MCPEPAMTVETRFLKQLGGVTKMRFMAGQLALPYANTDKAFGVMLFDRRATQ